MKHEDGSPPGADREPLAAPVRDVLDELIASRDDEASFATMERLSASGRIRRVDEGGEFLVDHYQVLSVLPGHVPRIRASLSDLEELDLSIAARFVDSYPDSSGEWALVVSRLPGGMRADSTVFGPSVGRAVSERAIERLCEELETFAGTGEFELRAFDPTNWLYDPDVDHLALRQATMRERGEPGKFLAEIEEFRRATIGKN